VVLQTFKRYELKYLLTEEQTAALMTHIDRYMKPDAYCVDGRQYTIYNIYYDNDNNDVIRHSLSHPYYKEKLRIRSYHPAPAEGDKVFVELKKKINKLVTKRRAVLTLAETAAYLERGVIPDGTGFMERQVLGEIGHFLDVYHPHPALYLRYDRAAFFGREDKNFRLTFDRSIYSRRTDLHFGPTDGVPLLEAGKVLMEVKISGAIPLWLARDLSEMGIFRTSFSKYGTEFKRYLLTKGNPALSGNILTKES